MAAFLRHTWMRLPLPEAEPGALFGASVAVCDELIVVGAPSKDRSSALGSRPDVGRAYVFEWDGAHWAPTATLAGTESRGGLLGAAVATDGARIAVGAPRARVRGTEHAGHVLVFRRGEVGGRPGWQPEARLLDPHGPEPDDGFGAALALRGDLLVVGAPLEISDAGPPGVVHAFRLEERAGWLSASSSRSRWREGPEVDPSPADQPGSLFGRHLSLDGDTLAATQDTWGGAPALVACFHLAGAGWGQPVVVRPPPGVVGAGAGVALDGDLLAVGIPLCQVGGAARAGVVCLFGRRGASWLHLDTLHAPAPAAGQRFGEAVALHGEVLVVGAPGQAAAGAVAAGAAHVFARQGERFQHRLSFQPASDDDRVAWSRVGEAVAVWGRTVVVGAPGADPSHGGAAYVIEAA